MFTRTTAEEEEVEEEGEEEEEEEGPQLKTLRPNSWSLEILSSSVFPDVTFYS